MKEPEFQGGYFSLSGRRMGKWLEVKARRPGVECIKDPAGDAYQKSAGDAYQKSVF